MSTRKHLIGGLACLTLLGVGADAAVAASPKAGPTGAYIVQLKAAPVASYAGGTAGLPATSPKVTGTRRSLEGATAARYRDYLGRVEDRALDRAPGASGRVLYRYRTTFAGFAARLTPAQAGALRGAPEVASVVADTLSEPQAINRTSPAAVDAALGGAPGFTGVGGDGASYLGLPNGLWNRLGGPDAAGQGIVVGVIDSGLQPGHPSFAATAAGNFQGPDYIDGPPQGWGGTCSEGSVAGGADGWTAGDCSNKVIGAQYYDAGFGEANVATDSHVSPADDDGHGSHTAATAAGNFGVRPIIDGNRLGFSSADDVISGIAPRAYLSIYKVCWIGNASTPDGCSNADSIAAIDRAVEDGVDVINFSVGSDSSAVFGGVEAAYLGASDAGVFVANSAGNAGPKPGSVGSPASVPWLTTVGASTLARSFQTTVTIDPPTGPDFTVTGESVTAALTGTHAVADAAASGVAGADAAEARRCYAGVLDPAKVANKVVLCERGGNNRIDKSKAVQAAGGLGMILYNPTAGQDTETDTHWVPSVHVSLADGQLVRAAIAAGATTETSFPAGTRVGDAALGGQLAAFSSRGPQTAVPDLLKPDVVAPGVNILAAASSSPAAATGLRPGQLFQAISGTSMSSPHVAGAAALLKQANPSLDPAEIKSALVTTARQTLSDPVNEAARASTYDQGAGLIDPSRAADPGLVLDARTGDYLSYLAGVAPQLFEGEEAPPVIRPVDLNLPSIVFSRLAGTDETERTFTSTDPTARSWAVTVEGLPGFDVEVPSTLNVRAGGSATLPIEVTRTSAASREAQEGALVLANSGRTVRLPIVVTAIPVAAPARVAIRADTSAGSQALPVRAGFAGTLGALGWGLAAPNPRTASITATSGEAEPDGSDPGTQLYLVTVPAGSQLLSARLSGVQDAANTDLDLVVYSDPNGDGKADDGEPLGVSASGTSDEDVTLPLPKAGAYVVAVVGFTTNGAKQYTVTTWVVTDPKPDDPSPAPSVSVSGDPKAVALGDPTTLQVDWAGVDKPGIYLGVATYHDSGTPTLDNLQELSVVELTKTRDTTPVVTPPPGVTPAPPTPPVPTPRAPRFSLAAARVAGRQVSFALTAYSTVRVKVTVRRGTRTIATSKTRTVKAGRRRLTVTVPRRLSKGTYKLSVKVTTAAGRSATRTLTLRVR